MTVNQYKNLSQYIQLEPSDFVNHIKTSMIKRKMLRKSPSVVSMVMLSQTFNHHDLGFDHNVTCVIFITNKPM